MANDCEEYFLGKGEQEGMHETGDRFLFNPANELVDDEHLWI